MPSRILIRLLVALGAFLFAFLSWRDTLHIHDAAISRQFDPMRFYRDEVGIAEARTIAASARQELTKEPISSVALRNLALTSPVLGQQQQTITQLELAERFSRRDAITELILLEHASSRRDFSASLRYLDRLVMVHPTIGRAIMDADMTMITADPVGRRALAQFANRPWFLSLIARSVEQAEQPDDIVNLVLQSGMTLPAGKESLLAGMLNQLLKRGRLDLAVELASRLGRADPRVFDDFGLSQHTVRQDLDTLVWQFSDSSIVSTEWTSHSGLQFDIGIGSPVILLERRTAMPAGTYRLDQRFGDLSGASEMRLEWRVACLGNGTKTEIWRQPVPLGRNLVSYRSDLAVPGECGTQRWRLMAPAIDAQTGVSFRLVSISLQRAK